MSVPASRFLFLSALALAGHAAALDIPAGASIGLTPNAPPEVVNLSGTLLLNTANGNTVAVTAVNVNAPTAAIDLQGPAGTITLGGPLQFGFAGYTLTITGDTACRLALPTASIPAGIDGILIANGPGVDAGTLTGVDKLRGSATGCTVQTLFASKLEKDGTGSWTITGDNSAQNWGYVDVGAGRLALASGARFGDASATIGGGAVLALPAGCQLPQRLTMQDGGTLDLADGVAGETQIPYLQGPVNGMFTFRLDISADGVDHIIVGDSGGTSGGRVVFNQVGPALTPGTYTFITNTSPNACLLEQHFGFDYIGNFENHYNIVYTSRLGQYDLTIRAVFVAPCWPAMTVTVTPSAGGDHIIPLALPLPGERGHEVITTVNTPAQIPLAGLAYVGTIVSYAYTQPAHGTVTGAGTNVTYTPAANYTGTDYFTFTVTDDGGETSAPAEIYIGVGASVNLPPTANPQLGVAVAANTAKSITLSGVDYGIAAYGTIVSYAYAQPAHGTVTGTGPNVIYTPAANYSGSDRFTFTVTDNEGAASTPALVTLIVGSGVTPPTPSLAVDASASPNPVAETSTNLSVLGADVGGEAALTYTWAAGGAPPAPVTFSGSANGTNAAKNITANFTQAGSYTLQATIQNVSGQTVVSSITVNVSQTLTSLSISPASATVLVNGTLTFTPVPLDQFGNSYTQPATFAWSVFGGSIGFHTGVYTAAATPGGPYTVLANSGGKTGSAQVQVVASPAVTGVSSTKPSGAFRAGAIIDINVSFDQAVMVTGTPRLTLATGGAGTAVDYSSGSGTNTLTFLYTVANGDASSALDYASSSALAFNGGTIKNSSNVDAKLALPAPQAAGSLSADRTLLIDTTPPSVTVSADSTETPEALITFTISFNEPVTGLTKSAIRVANGTTGAFTGSGSSYTLQVNADTPGPVTCTVIAAAARDFAGNDNTISNTASTTYSPVPLPSAAFAAEQSTVAETAGNIILSVTLSGTSTKTITLHYAASSGSAASGVNYTLNGNTLTFDPGEMERDITIQILNDGVDDVDKTLVLQLSEPLNATLGPGITHTLTITDTAPPVFSSLTGSPNPVFSGAETAFVAGVNSAQAVTMTWDFSDGAPATGLNVTHVFPQPGSYTVTATATDTHGFSATDTLTMTVWDATPPHFNALSASHNPVFTGAEVTFQANASSAQPLALSWDFGDGIPVAGNHITHIFPAAGSFPVTVTVTDTHGLSATDSLTLSVVAPGSADADDDGVSDAGEITAGTDPYDANSVPTTPLAVYKVQGAANFITAGKDSCSILCLLPGLPRGFDPSGDALLDISGAKVHFTLDGKGRGKSKQGSFWLKLPLVRTADKKMEFPGGDAALTVAIRNGALAKLWFPGGVPNDPKNTLPIDANLRLKGKVYTKTVTAAYLLKAGKSAKISFP